eukprot:CAMPEP_0174713052 /NCGR_PEP_ID=MMETSP1094-20130205/13852_1 /TAXON_ID=156173 /ORGANISM="Chrysochromulina brevifilum, Strain UTEX LB 985" /LENGTH=63 /DNA_ID=CAMNT_0015912193 /DNA_START=79 /DNA_END=267 /DNA_ORIENTATION=+
MLRRFVTLSLMIVVCRVEADRSRYIVTFKDESAASVHAEIIDHVQKAGGEIQQRHRTSPLGFA